MSRETKHTVEKRLTIRKELVRKVDDFLFSDIEGQVPYGAWKTYVEELIEEDFRRREFQVDDTVGPPTFLSILHQIDSYVRRVGNPEDVTFILHRLKNLRLHHETK